MLGTLMCPLSGGSWWCTHFSGFVLWNVGVATLFSMGNARFQKNMFHFIPILICSLRLVDAIKTPSVGLKSPVSAAALQTCERVKRTHGQEVFSNYAQLMLLLPPPVSHQADGLSGRDASGECLRQVSPPHLPSGVHVGGGH